MNAPRSLVAGLLAGGLATFLFAGAASASGFLAGRATWGLWLRDGRLSPTGGQGELLPARSLVSRHRVGIVNAPRCRVRAEDPGTWSSLTDRGPEGTIYG